MKIIIFCLLTSMSITFFISCDKIETAPILSGINQLQKQNDSLLQLVIQLQTSLDSVQNRVNQNTTLLNTINTNVTSLQSSVATLITNITLLKAKMDSANANISSIQLQLTTLTKQYTSLSNQISNVFASLSNQIDTLSIQTSANTVLLNLLQTNYLTTQIKVDSILLQIQRNNQLLATNNTNVAQIQTQLIALTTEYNNVITLLNQLIILINNQSFMPSLSDGLQAWYPFNGNVNDSSGNGWNGTTYGGVTSTTDRFGIANKAYHFNGQSGSHIITTYQGVLGSQSRTVSMWIRNSNVSLNATYILSWGSDDYNTGIAGGGYIIYISQPSAGNNSIAVDVSGSDIGPFTNTTIDGNWHHYVFVYDNPTSSITNMSNIKFYIDGVIYNSTLLVYQGNGTSNINTLKGDFLDFNKYGGYSGDLDEIRVYNRALTQAEITYLATH